MDSEEVRRRLLACANPTEIVLCLGEYISARTAKDPTLDSTIDPLVIDLVEFGLMRMHELCPDLTEPEVIHALWTESKMLSKPAS